MNRYLCETIQELRVQHDQELTALRYECNSLQARMATYVSRTKAFSKPLRVAHERLETYQRSSLYLHLVSELDLASGPVEPLIGFAPSVSDTVCVRRTCTVELILSVSEVL